MCQLCSLVSIIPLEKHLDWGGGRGLWGQRESAKFREVVGCRFDEHMHLGILYQLITNVHLTLR